MRAANAEGPNTEIPLSVNISANPFTSGASGPITTNSIAFLLQKEIIVFGSFKEQSVTFCAKVKIPGFPGNANNKSQEADCFKPLANACSLPPEPINKIFIRYQ